MSWLNDDGLFVKFGTEKPAVDGAGENTTDGDIRTIAVEIGFAEMGATGTTILSDGVSIPSGVFLESATFTVTTAFVGATATLGFGTIDTDRSTVHDVDGIDAAIAITAIDAIGDTIACDGALIGTVLSNSTPMLLTSTVATAALTAGAGQLVIKYRHV